MAWCRLGQGELSEGAVRPGCVVVLQVLGQRSSQMVLIDDQQLVEELPSQGADHPFADRVGRRRRLHLIQMIGISVSG